MKTWLKGGLIGAGIGFMLIIILASTAGGGTGGGYGGIFLLMSPILFVFLEFWTFVLELSIPNWMSILILIMTLLSPFINGFIIGSLIGLIITKLKKTKK